MTNHIQKKPLFYSHHFWKRFCNWINPKYHLIHFDLLLWIIVWFALGFTPSTSTLSWIKFESFGQPFISHPMISILAVILMTCATVVLDIPYSRNWVELLKNIIADAAGASLILLVFNWLPGYTAFAVSTILIIIGIILIIYIKYKINKINHKVDELIHDNH